MREAKKVAVNVCAPILRVRSIDALVPPEVAAEVVRLGLYRRVETPEGGGMLGEHPSERTTPT